MKFLVRIRCKVPITVLVAGFFINRLAGQDTLSINVPPGASDTEIQQALDCLPDTGGEVVLSSGTYSVTQPIVMRRSGQTLRGCGPATCLRLANQAQCPVIIMGEPVSVPQSIVSRLCISDLVIEGNRCEQSEETWQSSPSGSEIRNNGLTIQAVTDSSVLRVSASGCRSGGLVATHYVRNLVVQDFTATDNQFDGLACYCTESSLFTDLYLHHNQAAGISFDLSANHNVISNALLEGNDLGIFMRDSRKNLYCHIVIRDCRKFGVFLAQSTTPSGCQPLAHTECSGNIFDALQIIHCRAAAFRVNDLCCADNSITNSQFLDNPQGLSQPTPKLVAVIALCEW